MDLMLITSALFSVIAVLSLCATIQVLGEIKTCHKKYIIAMRALSREEFKSQEDVNGNA